MVGILSSLFGGGKCKGSYTCLEKYLKGKVKPSASEKEVKAQLEKIAAKLPKHKKSGMKAYIRGGAWKKVFVKK